MNRRQKLIVVEAAAGFALIMLYIWRLRFTAPRAWIFILGFFVLSHILRGERAASLGFRRSNFRECAETLAPALLLLTLSLLAGGVLLETIRPISLEYGFMCLLAYCPWGIFQQYLLNGYIANRLLAVSSARHVPLMAAALFAGAHLPNWFLMAGYFRDGLLQHQDLHAVPQYLFPGSGARRDRNSTLRGDPGLDQPSPDCRAGLLYAVDGPSNVSRALIRAGNDRAAGERTAPLCNTLSETFASIELCNSI